MGQFFTSYPTDSLTEFSQHHPLIIPTLWMRSPTLRAATVFLDGRSSGVAALVLFYEKDPCVFSIFFSAKSAQHVELFALFQALRPSLSLWLSICCAGWPAIPWCSYKRTGVKNHLICFSRVSNTFKVRKLLNFFNTFEHILVSLVLWGRRIKL